MFPLGTEQFIISSSKGLGNVAKLTISQISPEAQLSDLIGEKFTHPALFVAFMSLLGLETAASVETGKTSKLSIVKEKIAAIAFLNFINIG